MLIARRACSLLNHDWQTVVGLEIHAQILAQTKIFSGGALAFHQPPNADVGSVFVVEFAGLAIVLLLLDNSSLARLSVMIYHCLVHCR
jgi:hypothetical protein